MSSLFLRRLFQLRSDEWLRLGLFAIGLLYGLLALGLLLEKGFPVGLDFMVFFASAHIALTEGFPSIYDFSVQLEVQRLLLTSYAVSLVEPLPYFFLPPFLLPFLLLVPLGPSGGCFLWSLINLSVFVAYLGWYWRKAQEGKRGRAEHIRSGRLLLALAIFSFPAFANFLLGQANVLLMVCVGEFLRAWERRKPFLSGLWLGGLLLKPQTLVLVLPYLLLKGKWRALVGFALVLVFLGVLSVGLVGGKGLVDWAVQMLSHTGDRPSLAPGIMANFRMVGALLKFIVSSETATGVSIGLSLFVALWVLKCSLRKKTDAPWLSLFAATLTVTWHAYSHMAVLLIPLLFRGVATGRLPFRIFVLWAFFPSAFYLLCATILAILTGLEQPVPPIAGFAYPSLALLILHLYITAYGLSERGRRSTPALSGDS